MVETAAHLFDHVFPRLAVRQWVLAVPKQLCNAQMRIIAFIDEADTVKKILDHIGESSQPPRITPARGPPLWEAAESAGNDPLWDASTQLAPEIEFDQRIAW